MSDSKVTGKAFDLKLLRRILSYAAPYKGKFYFGLFLTLFISVLSTSRPILIQYTIDHYVVPTTGEPNVTWLGYMMLIMVAILILETFVQFGSIYITNWLGQNIIKDMRMQLYRHILSFKMKYFDQTPIGTLVTRAVSDIETISNIFSQGIIVIFGDLFKLAVVLVTMFVYNWRLALLSLAIMPFLIFAARIFQRAIKKAFSDVRTEVAKLNAFVQEHLTGMRIVQIFNREEQEFKKFQEINRAHMKANIRSIWHFSIFLPVVEISSAISIGLIVWWGGLHAALEDGVTLGDLIAFILFVNMMFRPIRQLADRFNTLQMGMVSSERVFKVLDTDFVISDEGSLQLDNVKGRIEFKDVVFGYNPDEPVLKGISFEVEEGQTLALVGATGAGKTSIINLLSRFYEISEGTITIDGKDIHDVALDDLRSHIAIVLQDVFLFSDSIYNNITLNEKIPIERIEEAAKIIGVDEFIDSLPDRYDYNVRERGGMLSAGQRQLISFLRAYISAPSILVLDEATSSVDTHTELLIQNAIDKLTENRTSIIIAHRLATIQKADQILVLEKGKIVERGNHQELLRQNGKYKELYELQFENEVPSP